MIRLLFQGDSITDGNRYKAPEKRWDLNHQIGHTYVFNVVGELGKKYPGKFTFINRGVSGDTVDKLKERWTEDTLNERPDVLSLLVGINGHGNFDGNFPEGKEAHLAHFEETYRSLLEDARKQNPELKIILVEPFLLPTGPRKERYRDFLPFFAKKREIVRKIAEDFGATFIPTQERLEKLVETTAPVLKENGCDIDPCAYWLWDGIHPTETMHSVLAEWWLDAALKILM